MTDASFIVKLITSNAEQGSLKEIAENEAEPIFNSEIYEGVKSVSVDDKAGVIRIFKEDNEDSIEKDLESLKSFLMVGDKFTDFNSEGNI